MIPLFAAATSISLLGTVAITHVLVAVGSYLLARFTGKSLPANPAAGVNLAAPAHIAGLDALLPLLRAIEAANGPLILHEAQWLTNLVNQHGGVGPLLENAFTQVLEARLADPNTRAPLLSQIATASGVTPRQLLNALEGKPTDAPGGAASPAVTVGLIGIAIVLALCGSTQAAGPGPAHWHADMKAPQQFYPAEISLCDSPLMRNAAGQLVKYECPCLQQTQTASQALAPAAVYYVPQASAPRKRAVFAPFRFVGRLFGRGC
jgi:hypothetical protein